MWLIPLCQAVFQWGGVFKHLWLGGVVKVWFSGKVQGEGLSGQTNLKDTSPSQKRKCSPDCGKNSVENRSTHYRKEGTIYHGGVGVETQVGKEKGRESVQCQNWGEKLSISWKIPPKHLLPYPFGGPGDLKPAALSNHVNEYLSSCS